MFSTPDGPPTPEWSAHVAGCPASRTARELAAVFAGARASVLRLVPVDSMERKGSLSAIDEAEELAVLAACNPVERRASE